MVATNQIMLRLPAWKVFPAIMMAVFISACDSAGPEARSTNARDAERSYRSAGTRVALTAPTRTLVAATRDIDAERGRALFISKSCVICHEVNGIGGRAAPSLSATDTAQDDLGAIDPLAFAARMWRGAPAMTALQAAELGYRIDLDARDLGDLAAFVASQEEQALLSHDDLPDDLDDWLINAPLSDESEWLSYRARGQRLPTITDFDAP